MRERHAGTAKPLLAVGLGALCLAWYAIRLPIFALLVILEPVVRLALSALALLCVLMAFLFEYGTPLHDFPFWGMMGFGVGCVLVLIVYCGLLRFFGR
jgi:hypothetical protein